MFERLGVAEATAGMLASRNTGGCRRLTYLFYLFVSSRSGAFLSCRVARLITSPATCYTCSPVLSAFSPRSESGCRGPTHQLVFALPLRWRKTHRRAERHYTTSAPYRLTITNVLSDDGSCQKR